jgi:DsbC/DsbD-like thiol-disulfide interchange protein
MLRSRAASLIAITILAAALAPTLLAEQAPSKSGDHAGTGRRAVGIQDKVTVEAGDVKARIALAQAHAFGGQQIGVIVDFDIAPGWHIYGKPLPEEYTPTSLIFDDDLLSGQKLNFPKPTPVKFELLGDTLPVYQGRFQAVGKIVLRQKLTSGKHQLGGTLSFQECNDNLCKLPQRIRFGIPLQIN